MRADGQVQKLARQIGGHCSSPVWDMAAVITGPNSTVSQPKIFSPDAPLRHCELCLRCLVRPEVGRQLVVEPQQICIEPHMTNDVICHYGIHGVGTFAMVEQYLYRGRITPDSISSLRRDQQVAYARLSHKAIALLLAGHSDAAVVEEAERLLSRNPHAIRRSDQGRAMYFIGRCLLNNNNPRATRYLLSAIYSNPFLFRARWSAALSLAGQCSSRPSDKRSGANAVPHDR
jgi:hypothetical protein